jgi:ATP-dependent Clp protease adaptor protein ClpS
MEDVLIKNINDTELKEPSLYNVVFYNDDSTPFEFVIEILMSIYDKQLEEAIKLATTIHQNGKQVVATYVKSIADMKVMETLTLSGKYNYPLTVTVEKE